MARPEIAETRPRIRSGVLSWTRLERMNTEIMSDAPISTSTATEKAKLVDSPNATVARPKPITAHSILGPTLFSSGRHAIQPATTAAPSAGAPRMMPRPSGPTARMSRANTGSMAVAPPSSTANRSSVMQPSRNRCRQVNCAPSTIWRMGCLGTASCSARTGRIERTSRAEPISSPAETA